MISSMTGFFRQNYNDSQGTFVWELRTVNHRYLDIYLRCPDLFRGQEVQIREVIQKHLSRGKVEATLKFIPGPKLPIKLSVNTCLLEKLSQAEKQVRCFFPDATMNITDILLWKDMLQTTEMDSQVLNSTMLALLEEVLVGLVSTRQREGAKLCEFIQLNTQKIKIEVEKIKQTLPEILTAERHRILQRLCEVQDQLDEHRLEQEMVIWAQRADVAEELQRLGAHLQEVECVLQRGDVVGRRLDFLMQELNREANTLSSKSMHVGMTQSAVEIKVLIEQMREQVQNIE